MKILGALLLVAALLGGCGFEKVDTGHRGLYVRFGEVQGEPVAEGLYFYNPFTTGMVELDVREKKLEGDTVAFTKDAQELRVRYALNYRPVPEQIGTLYKTLGVGWAQALLPQLIEGNMKASLGQWDAINIVENREKATRRAETAIREAAEKRSIVVTRLELTNIDFNKEFQKAIEAKVQAQQEAEKAKNDTVTIQEQARQAVISAKAEAESMRIRTEALSKSPALVGYEAVKKWDGKLPQYMLGNGALPFLSLGK